MKSYWVKLTDEQREELNRSIPSWQALLLRANERAEARGSDEQTR